jgi:hypothetical protein
MFGLDEIIKDLKLPQSILTLSRIHNETCVLLETDEQKLKCQKKIKQKLLKKINELI